MIDKRSTDPAPFAAERKTLRSHEVQLAIADHGEAQAFHENRQRQREERLRREAAAGPMFYPAPELPDGTPILNVRFSTRIRKALNAGGMKTIGEIREASDAKLLSLPDFGKESVAYLRQTLGLTPAVRVRQRLIIPLVAAFVLVGGGSMTVWSFSASKAVAPRASDELLEMTKGLEVTQQQAVDQLQIVRDQLVAQQNETKKLSEQIATLTEKLDALQRSVASIPTPSSAAPVTQPKAQPSKK